MSQEKLIALDKKVQKRNGQLVAFKTSRISNAIANAFKEINSLPREVQLPEQEIKNVEKITNKVIDVLNDRFETQESLNVEQIQDEVVRQLFENGYKDAAQTYANYRKQHAARRSIFELYSTIKRDGRVVSFKPEKITMAIVKALRAHEHAESQEPTPELLEKAKEISDGVVAEVRKQWTDGGAVHIEEIQDLVEKMLMAGGMHEIAKRYILYREERTRQRQHSFPELETSLEWIKEIKIKTSSGELKELNLADLKFTFDTCCQELEHVDPNRVLREAVKNYYNEIPEQQVVTANIMAARSFIEIEPEYSYLSARLLLLNLYHEVLGADFSFEQMKTEYRLYFPKFIKKAVELEHLSPELLEFDLDYIAARIDPKRDFLFKYMGLQTLFDRYFIHHEEKRLELPQIFWMRVAMGLAIREEDKNERAVEFYNMLSTFRFTSSTPTLFNSGTCHSQLSSCFLTTINDDLQHIFKCIQDDAMLSKWSGGLGNDWTDVRAMGARIKGTNGKSQGIIPFLKVANDTALAVNQGGKRQGAMCAYLEVWHLDIEEFLELRKNTGDDRRRTHDMHTANWIPDLFMKRVKNNGNWTLFSPSETPDLHHIFGQAFEKKYEEYEQLARDGKMKQYKEISAVHLWRKMLSMLFETGHPWITWKDPSNVRSPQQHCGVVHSSNLCTEILLNTSKDETAVCNLGSVNLAAHVTPEGIDHAKLKETVKTAVRMLDNVVDINFYPTQEAGAANQRHRPVGLGLMGFQDALFIQNISYASQEAVEFADESMEAISYYAILASSQLASEKGKYSSYSGSFWDQGILPYDTLNLLEKERGGYLDVDRSMRMDWQPVRDSIKTNGMRNSLVMAIAPTATIANIVGVTSSIEPIYKNVFVKSNLSGEFTVINEYLVEDLKELGLWDQEMIDDLKYFDGSVQEIDRIPEEIKQKYATSFEIEYEWMIECASRRQKWIDMGQSLNLYQAKPSGKKVSDMYLLGWEKGLKTTYYLRSMGATRIEKSTLDITKAKYVDNIVGRRQRDEKGHIIDGSSESRAPVHSGLSVEPSEDCEACQ